MLNWNSLLNTRQKWEREQKWFLFWVVLHKLLPIQEPQVLQNEDIKLKQSLQSKVFRSYESWYPRFKIPENEILYLGKDNKGLDPRLAGGWIRKDGIWWLRPLAVECDSQAKVLSQKMAWFNSPQEQGFPELLSSRDVFKGLHHPGLSLTLGPLRAPSTGLILLPIFLPKSFSFPFCLLKESHFPKLFPWISLNTVRGRVTKLGEGARKEQAAEEGAHLEPFPWGKSSPEVGQESRILSSSYKASFSMFEKIV